ncbi:hypothetical protein D3C78_1949430 [compost metagenome]
MRVGGKHYVITQLMGPAYGRIDTVIGLQTANNQSFEVFAWQKFTQVSLVKRAPGGLAYAQVTGDG